MRQAVIRYYYKKVLFALKDQICEIFFVKKNLQQHVNMQYIYTYFQYDVFLNWKTNFCVSTFIEFHTMWLFIEKHFKNEIG